MDYYGSKAKVYHGTAKMTKGGLTKKDIIRITDKSGVARYKSINQQNTGKKTNTFREKWAKAMVRARKELIREGIFETGTFDPIGGNSRAGKALLKRIREIMV